MSSIICMYILHRYPYRSIVRTHAYYITSPRKYHIYHITVNCNITTNISVNQHIPPPPHFSHFTSSCGCCVVSERCEGK